MLYSQHKYSLEMILTKPVLKTHPPSLGSNAISLKFYQSILNITEREIIDKRQTFLLLTAGIPNTSAPKNNESVSDITR